MFEAVFWPREMQLMVFPLLAALGFAGAIWLYRHYHAIHDTPTSAIDSAMQGYVEFTGTAALLPGTPLRSPGGTACCWYSAWDRSRVAWVGSKYRPSHDPFLLVDETGTCAVLPEGMGDIATGHEETWDDGSSRGHARLLLPGDKLYVLGELVTLRIAAPGLAANLEQSGVNARWLLRKPGFGRIFWVAMEEPDTLEANARFGAWMSLAFFLYFAVGFVLVLLFRVGPISIA